MFETAALLGETEREIPLGSFKGDQISNYVEAGTPPSHAVQAYQELVRVCGGKWEERKPATGRYNCAGHVWASRRTTILDPKLFEKIIDDDGYRRLSDKEPVYPGDIAVYADGDANNEILAIDRRFNGSLTVDHFPICRRWLCVQGCRRHCLGMPVTCYRINRSSPRDG